MNLTEFQASLQDPPAAYLLRTDQDYLKRRVYEIVQEQIEEEARAFDWAAMDLSEQSPQELVSNARTLPWMSQRRWIYVRHAELGSTALADYLQSPSERCVLVLESAGKVSGWPKLPVIQMETGSVLASWVRRRVQQAEFSIEGKAVALLVDLVGDDVQRLEAELEKQFLFEMDTRAITEESVYALTREVRQRDIFELIGAIAGRKRQLAIKLLHRLYDGGTSPQQILSMLYWSFCRLLVAREMLEKGRPFFSIVKELKIWSYRNREREVRGYHPDFLAEVLMGLRKTDRLCKTTSTDPRVYLDRLLFGVLEEGTSRQGSGPWVIN